MKANTIISGLLFVALTSSAVLKTSAGNGNWTTNGTWSPAGQPACGDSVVILAAHTVSISSQVNYSGCGGFIVVIRGTLYFTGGSKLRLPCGAKVYIMPGGTLNSDGAGNSNQLELCGTTVWTGSSGPVPGPACIPASLPGCNSVVLPVLFSDFYAEFCLRGVCLYWRTLSEYNISYFEIYRAPDAYNFTLIKDVPTKAAGGFSSRTINYESEDYFQESDLIYYRLKQVNKDGGFEFSNIVTAQNIEEAIDLMIYPNPSGGNFKIASRYCQQGGVLHIYNMLAEKVFSLEVVPQRKMEMNFDLTGILKKGLYVVDLTCERKKYTAKFCIN